MKQLPKYASKVTNLQAEFHGNLLELLPREERVVCLRCDLVQVCNKVLHLSLFAHARPEL